MSQTMNGWPLRNPSNFVKLVTLDYFVMDEIGELLGSDRCRLLNDPLDSVIQ